ncbi:hypothetical protein WJX74_009202 [Apatococcus lobatus]|uniref:O-methyltransferase domain-containing protein n=1 Tax=Apatococcus lobatus TaxID=904363 RepID=A0AAW1QYM4_9CHLO
MSRGGRLIAVGISGLLVGLALNQSFIPGTSSGTLNGFAPPDAFDILPGWLLASVGPYVVHISRSMSTWFLPSFVRLADLSIFNVWTGHVILALNHHGIADLLADGPKSAEELAEATGTDPQNLFRLLRVAVNAGVFSASNDRTAGGRPVFANNALSTLMQVDHPSAMHAALQTTGLDAAGSWVQLSTSLSSGQVPFHAAYGQSLWEHLSAHPDKEKTFTRSMAASEGGGALSVASQLDCSQYGTLVDVGGASGSLLAEVLDRHSNLHGILFDLPQVSMRSRTTWAQEHPHLINRTQIFGGSFLEPDSIPVIEESECPRPAYLLRFILHDWDTPWALKILRNVRQAMQAGPCHSTATLIIIDQVLKDDFQWELPQKLLMDINMWATVGGQERTLSEWQSLLAEAGFGMPHVQSTQGYNSIITTRLQDQLQKR